MLSDPLVGDTVGTCGSRLGKSERPNVRERETLSLLSPSLHPGMLSLAIESPLRREFLDPGDYDLLGHSVGRVNRGSVLHCNCQSQADELEFGILPVQNAAWEANTETRECSFFFEGSHQGTNRSIKLHASFSTRAVVFLLVKTDVLDHLSHEVRSKR